MQAKWNKSVMYILLSVAICQKNLCYDRHMPYDIR